MFLEEDEEEKLLSEKFPTSSRVSSHWHTHTYIHSQTRTRADIHIPHQFWIHILKMSSRTTYPHFKIYKKEKKKKKKKSNHASWALLLHSPLRCCNLLIKCPIRSFVIISPSFVKYAALTLVRYRLVASQPWVFFFLPVLIDVAVKRCDITPSLAKQATNFFVHMTQKIHIRRTAVHASIFHKEMFKYKF